MVCFLDTNIIIYAVEGQPALRQRARNHIAALEASGHQFVVSELTWTECLVFPLRMMDGALLLEYHQFLLGPNLITLGLTRAIHQRAAQIRATYRYGLADSLHLATAVEYRVNRFLTNDQSLATFPDVTVEMLP